MSDGEMFSVFGRMTALPGRRDELIAVLAAGFDARGDDSGLIAVTINAALDDPDTIWLTQLWVDKEAHDTTTRSGPVVAATGHVPALLAKQPEGFYGRTVHAGGQALEA